MIACVTAHFMIRSYSKQLSTNEEAQKPWLHATSTMCIGVCQLKIDTEMVKIVTSFFLGEGALAFGLAFSLGT